MYRNVKINESALRDAIFFFYKRAVLLDRPGRYINVQHCGGLSTVLLQLKDPLELYVKSHEMT